MHSHAVAILCQGDTAIDTLRWWQREYSRELDQETRQESVAMEKLLRKALVGEGEAFASSWQSSPVLPLLNVILNAIFPLTYICLPQGLLLQLQPSLSMACRTASCLMLRTRSRCCPTVGTVPLAKTGPRTAGTLGQRQHLPAPNDGRAMAQRSTTEAEEQSLLSSMG